MDREWWLWCGHSFDVDDRGRLRQVELHWELYAIHLQNGHPMACAGPIDSGVGTGPGKTTKPPQWPLGRQGWVTRKGRKGYSAGECPFLSHPAILSTLTRRITEFTQYPFSETFQFTQGDSPCPDSISAS